MAYTIITQEHVDNLVLGIAAFTVDFAERCLDLFVQGDPDAWNQEQKLIAVQSVLWSLRDYDITTEILTEDEVMYLEELATSIIQDCPM